MVVMLVCICIVIREGTVSYHGMVVMLVCICIVIREGTLSYHGMVVTTVHLPTGLAPSNLLQACNQSLYLDRLELNSGQLNFYLSQVCMMMMNGDHNGGDDGDNGDYYGYD
jgi:hypothetical protein